MCEALQRQRHVRLMGTMERHVCTMTTNEYKWKSMCSVFSIIVIIVKGVRMFSFLNAKWENMMEFQYVVCLQTL